MKKAQISTSTLAEFEDIFCSDCLNNPTNEEEACHIAVLLAWGGECDSVFELDSMENGCLYKCMMKCTDKQITTKDIKEYIGISSTEDVGTILEHIEESYHYDVIRRGRCQ